MAPPSSLPSWKGFNDLLFECLRDQAARLVPADLLSGLSLSGRVPVTAFSDLVVRTFAGDSYYPLLTALEGAAPNANHTSLALLAKAGVVSDIVSFNFDTLIEQAFRDQRVALEVLVRPEDYDRLDLEAARSPRLHKVHGSVTDAKSLIDTITQKLQGLAAQRRIALAGLFKDRHVLFIGFSGQDFNFGSDYLPMEANRAGGNGFTWVYRCSPPSVSQVLTRPDGVFLAGSLPEFFGLMGVPIDPLLTMAAAYSTVDLRQQLDAFVSRPYVGPWSSAALFQRLAEDLGQEAIADKINETLVERLVAALSSKKFDPTMGAVARQLALAALSRGDTERALAWSAQELHFHEATMELLSSDGRAPRPEVRLEYLRNTASVWSNIGLAHARSRRLGARDAARSAFRQAQQRAEDARDKGIEALLLLNAAEHVEEVADEQLKGARLASEASRAAGAGLTQLEALFLEAKLLLQTGEIDLAIEAMDQAVRLLPVVGAVSHAWRHGLLRAEAAARRGDWDAGLTICERLLASVAPVSPHLAGTLAARLRNLLAFNAAGLDRLTRLIRSLGDDGDVVSMPMRVVISPGNSEAETRQLQAIAEAEVRVEHDTLVGFFHGLCAIRHRAGGWERLIDAANGLKAASTRANDAVGQVIAQQYLGIAYDLLNQPAKAAQAFRAAIAGAPAAGMPIGDFQANLAAIVWRQGDAATGEELYRAAQVTLRETAQWNSLATAMVNFGLRLVSAGRRAEAIALLRETAEVLGLDSAIGLANALRSTADSWTSELADIVLPGIPVADRAHLEDLRQHAWSAASLGNLGIQEIELGEFDQARVHIDAARDLYRAAGDLAGESRCWSNLSQLYGARKEWSQAVEAARQALALRVRAGDLEGRILVMSNLAAFLLMAGQAKEAIAMARSCVGLAPAGEHSRQVMSAQLTEVRGLCLLGRWGDLRGALAAARAAVEAIGVEEYEDQVGFLDDVAATLVEIERASEEKFDISADAVRAISSANNQPEPSDRAEVLRQALAEDSWNDVDRATILGEYANAMNKAAKFSEAHAAYSQAIELYAAAGLPGMVWHTRCVRAFSLDASGATDAAEAAVHEVLRDCPVAKVRANLLTGHANLVLQRRGDDVEAVTVIRDQLRSVVVLDGIDAETLGRALLQLAQCEWHLENRIGARKTLSDAKALLVRSNSRLLSVAAKLEAAYGETL